MTRLSSVVLLLFVILVSCYQGQAQEGQSDLFPQIEPYKTGHLQVSEIHQLYWELVGNPQGTPVIFLHGGPGGMSTPGMRRYFDPQEYHVLLFDQRGSGRSKPFAEHRENTTDHLIEDINKLREHVGFKGKAILHGGSWGSTLAVAYAERYPDLVSGMVLRGVFLASQAEIDHFYHGGTRFIFPRNYQRLLSIIPNPEQKNYPEQLYRMITEGDEDTRKKAVDTWAAYEIRMVSLDMTDEQCSKIVDQYDMSSFSLMENYYMMNLCFLEDGQLLENADKIADIPTFIVNGRFDVICPPITAVALADKLNDVKLVLPVAAHSTEEPGIRDALLAGMEWVHSRIKK
jgi:proline iminopeptidase